jgi:hypothetical protein
MRRRTVDGGGPSKAAGHRPRAAPAQGPELAQRVLLHWRVRCLVRMAPLRATSGSDALSLCAALLWTLEHRSPAPGLALAARRWVEGAASVPELARASECLAEVVTEIARVAFPALSPQTLEHALDVVADEVAAAPARRAPRPGVDRATGLADRRALERDLDALVAAAVAGGGIDLALAVVEPEHTARGSLRHTGWRRGDAGHAALGGLVSALRRATAQLGGNGRLYRLGARRLAVLLPRGDSAALGALLLWATCRDAPPFLWGSASLRAGGPGAAAQPDALVVLAEADLHLRRRDLFAARAALARQHRRRRVAGSLAAAVVVLAGVALGLAGGPAGRPGLSALGLPPAARSGPPTPSTPPAPATPAAVAAVPSAPAPSPAQLPAPGGVQLVEAVEALPSGGGASPGMPPSAPAPGGPPGSGPPAPGGPPGSGPPGPPPPPAVPPVPLDQVVGAVVGTVGSLVAALGV